MEDTEGMLGIDDINWEAEARRRYAKDFDFSWMDDDMWEYADEAFLREARPHTGVYANPILETMEAVASEFGLIVDVLTVAGGEYSDWYGNLHTVPEGHTRIALLGSEFNADINPFWEQLNAVVGTDVESYDPSEKHDLGSPDAIPE